MYKVFIFTSFFLGLLFFNCSFLRSQTDDAQKRIIANPLNLNYRFQFDEPSRREAADPVIEYFKGKYYLFASKSGGYWSSPDLGEWAFIPSKSITTIEDYAPTVLVHNDALYYIGSGNLNIFKTENPDADNWQPIETKFSYGMTDPAFYKDDDGQIYLYWGCSDVDPIMGVKVDPDNGFKAIGEPVVLITHKGEKYGWEVPGVNNEENRTGWNEGPCIIKYKGKYYLQYAAPGTQYRIYGDGLYVSNTPLGPYVYVESSPFSFKPGGFIGGAGHGHTFQDKYGNYWHVATMTISVRHMFERRIGLFPTYMSSEDELHSHTVMTDYPFCIPDRKINVENENCSTGWNILSYDKKVTAYSSITGYEAEKAVDEKVETWWAATSGKKGEWLQIDLGKKMTVEAIQINFADHGFTTKRTDIAPIYQYYIECSDDGSNWKGIIDRGENTKDMPHELVVLDKPVKTRYIRIVNVKEMEGNLSLYDLRVFGNGGGKKPQKVEELDVQRDKNDTRKINLSWPRADNAQGYILRWGVKENQLKNATMIYSENVFEGRFFNRDSDYYFSIDSFNENGITEGKKIYGTLKK